MVTFIVACYIPSPKKYCSSPGVEIDTELRQHAPAAVTSHTWLAGRFFFCISAKTYSQQRSNAQM